MSIVSSGQLTISDINDAKQLVLYLNPSVRNQIYNPNATGSTAYNPDFTGSNLTFTPELYVAGGGTTNLLPSSAIVSCNWYEGSQTTNAIGTGNTTGADGISSYSIPTGTPQTTLKVLTVKSNLTNKNSQKFTCVVVYHDDDLNADITMKADVEVVKVTNGVKGADGTGTDAVVGVLSNENSTIPANSSGTATAQNLALATTTLKIFEGTDDITSSYTVSIALNPNDTTKFNVTTSGTPANSVITVSTMTDATASASVTFTATRSGYPTITKVFNVSKLNAGTNGSEVTINWLDIPSTLAVSNTGAYARSTLTFKSYSKTGASVQQAYDGFLQVDTSPDGTTWTNAVANTTQFSSGSYTYPASGSMPTGIKFIRVRLYSATGGSGLLDEETISIIAEGNDAFFCNMVTPQGDMIRNSSGQLTVKAELVKGSSPVTPTAIKWYVQDPAVTIATNGGGGDTDGGIGWRLLQTVADATTAPTLNGATAGGTLTGATYFVKYTWCSTNGETLPSAQAQLAVTANYNLKITVPAFPTGVFKAKVYVGTVTGTVKYQGDINTSAGTYTITAPINTTNPQPPSTNTATYTQTVTNFATDTITVPATAITNFEGFKAILTYNTLKYSGIVVLKDISDPILCRIDGVEVFKNGDGTNTYRATLIQGGSEIDSSGTKYTYTWSIWNKDGTKTTFNKTGKTTSVDATDITNIGNLLCEVSL
jgi:hypothetical protein